MPPIAAAETSREGRAAFSRLIHSSRFRQLFRGALFLYLCLVVCPLQYFPMGPYVDSTWFFALNYAAARHLVVGRDITWTSGPLGYLSVPQNVGHILQLSLIFQAGLWLVAITVVWNLVFRANFRLRNLVFFAFLFGLASRSFQYPTLFGGADLLLTLALLLLFQFELRGGLGRYIAALVMIGFAPLIAFVALIMGTAIIAGLIIDRLVNRGSRWKQDIVLAVVIPAFVTGLGYWLTMGSWVTVAKYLRANLEISSGYSSAMSLIGPKLQVWGAIAVFFLLGGSVAVLALRNRRTAWFLTFLLIVPLLMSFKHGFVRQDQHVVYFFCFAALCLAMLALVAPLESSRPRNVFALIVLLFCGLWGKSVLAFQPRSTLADVAGARAPVLLWRAVRFARLQDWIREKTQQFYPPELRLEPEIKAIVQHQPVASLSTSYNFVFLDGLDLRLYPVVQRYAAYTPYLDQLNAEWLRENKPSFLIFDAQAIDGRHPWTDTPAMWLEVYRWYDARYEGPRNLLLQRREQRRFKALQTLSTFPVHFGDALHMLDSAQPVFWSMRCNLSMAGRIRASLFRVAEVTMTVAKADGQKDTFRVPLAVLVSPSPGNYLPETLHKFAEVFEPHGTPTFLVKELSFDGPGTSAYLPECSVEISRPIP